MRVLYVTHYGILKPLGQTQIVPYLLGVARRGCSLSVISFEERGQLARAELIEAQRRALAASGVNWMPRPYRPGRNLRHLAVDLARTAAEISRLCARNSIDLIHCRTHVPYLMAWPALTCHRRPVLLDFRGFLAEEYVDAGLWPRDGIRFRGTKILERRMLAGCAAIVVLTNAVRDYFTTKMGVDGTKMFVIPCCVDLDRFQAGTGPLRMPGRSLKVIYSGSTVGRYRIVEMLEFFRILLAARPGSRLTILSSSDPSTAQNLVSQSRLPAEAVTVLSVTPSEVPAILAGHDLGLIFIRGNLGLLAASPTKLGEYLASGLVVAGEDSIGGLRELLASTRTGCVIKSEDPTGWGSVAEQVIRLCDDPDSPHRSRKTAELEFSLPRGVETYLAAYRYAVGSARGETYFGTDRA
jgi:glycosyltransferase involved in cell wall biosynthesis